MQNPISTDVWAGIIRSILMAIFGGLVVKGYVTNDQLVLIAGALAGAVVVIGLSVWSKIKAKYALEAARDLPAHSTIEEIRTVANEKLADASVVTKLLP